MESGILINSIMQVVATVRSLAKFPESLKAAGAQPLIMDLCGKDEEIRKAAEDAIKVFGHVDVLVNNAGSIYSGVGPVEELEYVFIYLAPLVFDLMMATTTTRALSESPPSETNSKSTSSQTSYSHNPSSNISARVALAPSSTSRPLALSPATRRLVLTLPPRQLWISSQRP